MGEAKRKKLISLTMFNLLKGFAMISVVFRHSLINQEMNPVWNLLYSVLMPMFFVMSGYYLKKNSVRKGAVEAWKQIMMPYFITVLLIDAVGLIHRTLTGDIENWLSTFLIPGFTMVSGSNYRFGPLWFLPALFVSWVIFYAILTIKSEKVQMAAVFAVSLTGGLLMRYGIPVPALYNRVPLQIPQAMLAEIFVYTGYYFKSKKYFNKDWPFYVLLVLALVWLPTAFVGSTDMSMYDVSLGVIGAVGSTCGVLVLIYLSLRVNLLDKGKLDPIRTVGRYTMWIISIHAFENAIIPWHVIADKFPQNGAGMYAGSLVIFICRSVFIFVVCAAMLKLQRFRTNLQYKKKESISHE